VMASWVVVHAPPGRPPSHRTSSFAHVFDGVGDGVGVTAGLGPAVAGKVCGHDEEKPLPMAGASPGATWTAAHQSHRRSSCSWTSTRPPFPCHP
jgi:hypothetical protein